MTEWESESEIVLVITRKRIEVEWTLTGLLSRLDGELRMLASCVLCMGARSPSPSAVMVAGRSLPRHLIFRGICASAGQAASMIA